MRMYCVRRAVTLHGAALYRRMLHRIVRLPVICAHIDCSLSSYLCLGLAHVRSEPLSSRHIAPCATSLRSKQMSQSGNCMEDDGWMAPTLQDVHDDWCRAILIFAATSAKSHAPQEKIKKVDQHFHFCACYGTNQQDW